MANKTELLINTEQALGGLNGILNQVDHIEPIQDVVGAYLVQMIRRTIRTEGGGSWEKSKAAQERGGGTLRDRGRFFNSFDYEIRDNEVVVGSNSTQAAILYYGGEIRPVNKKFLTVPIHRLARRKRATDFKNTYAIFNRQDFQTGVIMLERKGKGEDIPIFALVKKVTIPGWDYLQTGPKDVQRIQNIVGRHVIGGAPAV